MSNPSAGSWISPRAPNSGYASRMRSRSVTAMANPPGIRRLFSRTTHSPEPVDTRATPLTAARIVPAGTARPVFR